MNNASRGNEAEVRAQQLLNIINNSEHIAYITLDQQLAILSISPNLARFFSEPSLDHYLHEPITSLFGEFVGVEEELTAVINQELPSFELENIARGNDGTKFCYFTLTVLPLTPPSTEAKLVLLVEQVTKIGRLQQRLTQQRNMLKQEMTRREKAEAALKQLNEELEQRVAQRTAELAQANERLRLLEAAIANTTDTVVITEAEPINVAQAGIVYVNEAFTKATGYSYKEILGQSRQLFYGPNTDPQQLEKIREALLNEKAVHVEMISYRKDGSEFWVDMTVAPIVNEDGNVSHYVSIERDATKRKQLEDALLQSQKMEAVGLLAGGMAHDFNNILTIINSYSDLLLRRFREDESVTRYIHPIFTASKRAGELTAQLLAFSRRQLLSFTAVNLNDIILEVINLVERPIGEDIQFTTLLAPQLWPIRGDLGQLSQVVLNLFMNAREAMKQGGMIVVETENVVLGEENGRISPQLEPGPYAKVSFTDSGTGIRSEDLTKIFDPFFTTKPVGKGSGLGLSTAYGIIAQSGGGIAVESKIGGGTTFELFLPRLVEHEAEERLEPTDRDQKQTLLLVEDDPDVRALFFEGLQIYGYKVLQASNGEAALRVFEQYGDSIDMLVTDVIMPGMNGYDLAEELSAKQPDLQILFMTGYSETLLASRGLKTTQNVLLKPFTLDRLLDRIAATLSPPDQSSNP